MGVGVVVVVVVVGVGEEGEKSVHGGPNLVEIESSISGIIGLCRSYAESISNTGIYLFNIE